MKSQSAVLTAVAAALLLILFVAGAVYVNAPRPPAPSPAATAAAHAPDAPAIVEASPSLDASPDSAAVSRTIPTPPSFNGAQGDAATNRVNAYLRWLAEIEIRRHMAVAQMMGSLQNSGFAIDPTAACQGKLPNSPAPAGDSDKIRRLQEEIAANRERLTQLAQEAKSAAAPEELKRFHRPYGDFLQWNGDVLSAMTDIQRQMLTALERGDADAVCKLTVRYASTMEDISQQDARLSRLLADLNNELDSVRANRPDVPDSLRSLKIEMP